MELADLPPALVSSGDVVVEVILAGICGSDIHGYLGHSERRSRHLPLVMGHEIVGRVTAAGCGVASGPGIGERVVIQPMTVCHSCRACRSGRTNLCERMAILGIETPGGFATHVAVPAGQVFPVPETMTDLQAVLVEPLAIEVRAFREFAGVLPRSVLVLGAGSQGLLAIHLARMMGIPTIIATDTIPERLDLARTAGATDVLLAGATGIPEGVRALTDGYGAEFAIESAGAAQARRDGIAALARGGTLALVGLGTAETTIDALDIVASEKRIHGVYCYSDDDFARALEILASGAIDVDPMTAIRGLSTGADAFARIVDGSAPAVKILLDPSR